MNGDPGAAGLDEGHELALVVGGAAAVDVAAAVRPGAQLGLEPVGVDIVEGAVGREGVTLVPSAVRAPG